jgi:magnesium transporter
MVFKSAHYIDDAETIEFGQIQAFVGTDFIFTVVNQGEASMLNNVRKQMEDGPDRLRRGPHAILYEIISEVVEGCAPVAEGLETDIDEIEAEVFAGNSEASRRIHELFREIIRFHQAIRPLVGALDHLTESASTEDFDPETRRLLRLAQSHLLHVTEQTEGFREPLSSILSVNLTMVGVQLNDQAQKISAWAAILAVPTSSQASSG